MHKGKDSFPFFSKIALFFLLIIAPNFVAKAGNVGGTEAPDCTKAQQDYEFLLAYSHKLGFQLDSCCNKKLVAAVTSWLGVPYRAAGCTKSGTDCSGFVMSIYRDVFNLNLSHSGGVMLSQMKHLLSKNETLKEGDILFFRRGKRISHVALYLGNNKFIHSATVGRGVVVDDIRTPYYRKTFFIAGRPFRQEIVHTNL